MSKDLTDDGCSDLSLRKEREHSSEKKTLFLFSEKNG